MSKGRLEAFSDGVVAILITIMVLELHVPQGTDLESLRPLAPILLSYVLSFINIGIYWNNHHHLLQAATAVNGRVLWANLHLLFWLSLVPFATTWMGEHGFAPIPTAAYGGVLLMAGIGFTILVRTLIATEGQAPTLAVAIGSDRQAKVSLALYSISVPLAIVAPLLSLALFAAVAGMWFIPDRRIERVLAR